MTWRTHVAIGTNAIWIAGLFGPVTQSVLVLLPAAMLASILPDIDAIDAKIHYVGGGLLYGARGSFRGKYFHHRGMMHSLLVAAIFLLVLLIFSWQAVPALAFVFSAAYFSHSFIDGFNSSVGYLYPFVHKRFALVPRPLLSKVGGPLDRFLLILGLAGLLLFFFIYRFQLFQSHGFGR